MFYLYIAVLIFLVLLVLYMMIKDTNDDEHNLMEDVPTISVNKEDLEKHAAQISQFYSKVTRKSNCRRKLMKSLDKSYADILKTYEYIDKDVKYKRDVVPAAEWMLDNLYLIEKEYKDIKHNMPSSYYRGLPVINKGILKGYPRIYHIAVELVSHTDGRVDEKTIELFINAYQKNTILTIGELWALPIMIRIALIQNISKISERIIYSQEEKKRGDLLAERFINAYNENRLQEELNKSTFENMTFSSHFVERFLKIIRDNGVDSAELYKWLDEKLEFQQVTAEKMISTEHQKQAAFQISIGNSITSIREVEAINWRDAFEKLSFVEQILKEDPANIYKYMDFESRDYYRHKVEKLAKHINADEIFVAKKALECAALAEKNKDYLSHIGYYLIDDGMEILKTRLNFKEKGFGKLKGVINKNKIGFYIGTILTSVVLLCFAVICSIIAENNNIPVWKLVTAFIVLIIPCSEIVISIFNWSINHLFSPRFIPKMEFEQGIPEECSTVVVIPTLLNNQSRVHELIADLEVYYLANQEKNIYFALLGDFKDSAKEHEENDSNIVKAALADVKALNEKYSKNGEEIFFFLNRYRQYNEKEGIWLGWERKRGKLMEFNALLRGDNSTSYNVISGDINTLRKAKYVITLDADTQLPRDIAKKLIGAMSHVLNKPHIDYKNKRVLRGYGLMQPRVSVSTIAANKTMFSKIFSGETGIDMYTTAVSDVYQDLFGEGIFTGKGIYDVDVFNYMLKDEIPENTVLSHDLLEGSYVRTALVTDVELIDGYPAYYNSSAMRLHRWTRGDWQIIRWLAKKSPLNTLSKWKILDNLRRSLLAPSIMLLVILSFAVLPRSDQWLIVAFLAILCPIFFDVSEAVVSPIKGISLSGKINNEKIAVEQVFLIFCFLPYQAYLMLDAIVRTIYRLTISKRKLLEWQTAADVEAKLGRKLGNFIAAMWPGSLISVIVLILAFNNSASSGILMLPSCILWFVSPVIAYYISREIKLKSVQISSEQIDMLRRFSRKTWAYFEDFVDDKNNYLAPDNFQEDPLNGVATRTSPTNMGMGLTSNLAAYDLGYIGILEAVERIEKILNSMEDIKRYKGHFYNWYDTVSKEPLHPRYISTVDSGNLVGYLWLTAESLKEYINNPVICKNKAYGLIDTLNLCSGEIESSAEIKDFYSNTINNIKKADLDIISWKKILMDVWSKALEIEKVKGCENLYWNSKCKHSVIKYLTELQKLFPWTDLIIERPDNWEGLCEKLKTIASQASLKTVIDEIDKISGEITQSCIDKKGDVSESEWLEQLNTLLDSSRNEIINLLKKIENLRERLNNMAESTDFSMLYDKKRGLFAIGYDIEKDTLGNSYYDLLASESRQASFVAIAKKDVEQKHWFKLSRAMTIMGKSKGLVSWSGTMFEYFMPLLIMKNYPDTLLNETYKAVVDGQKRYAAERKVPWGISESAYHTFDPALNYQYKAFGVPGIGLKRGLVNELVISPYSTVMALQIDFDGAIKNMKNLVEEGLEGRYGFYEAVDYTKERLPKGKNKAIIKCFMVHHEGMSLMALNNVLNSNILQERFHRIPCVKATELLLQERIPRRVVYDREQKFEVVDVTSEKQNIVVRSFNTAKTKLPETHILSNGSYSLMLTNSGSGYGKLNDMTVYRWREDPTLDNTGMFFYIKNLNSNEFWSSAYEPSKTEGENYEVIFSLDKAEFKRKDGNLVTHTEIAVSQEDNAEVRRISITNHSEHSRTVEITSYLEVTLAPYNADIVHPAFSNLFIRTEFVENPGCIIANRRPRAKGQKKPHLIQTIAVSGETVGSMQFETSRANFLGRGRDVSNPLVMENDAPLKNSVGAVLDPIISIRRRLKIRPGETVKIAYTTAVADSREEAVELARKYSEMHNINRVFELAWTQTQVELKYLGIKSTQANLYQHIASKILFINSNLRARESYIKNIKKFQSSLWPYGISGDVPILLIIIRSEKDVDLVRQVLQAHEYWSIKGLKVDLVILNLQNTLYVQPLLDSVRDLISSSHARDKMNKTGGVFLHSRGSMAAEDVNFLISVARLVVDAEKGNLLQQIKDEDISETLELLSVKEEKYDIKPYKFPHVNLEFFNGYGGFDTENDEYTIILKDYKNTPAPWINVISNGEFGFHISESGSSYTWFKNSRENKITTWSNDPITDPPTEALYLRDEITGKIWSITSKPVRDEGEYRIQHGFGYSVFKHEAEGVLGELTVFAAIDESVKLGIVKLKNNTKYSRRLSLTYYAQLVLGVVPQSTAQYISTYLDEEKNFIYAQNPYSEHFGRAYAYLRIAGGEEVSYTGDRTEFLGRGGSTAAPEGLKYKAFSNNVGSGFDPCLTVNTKVSIAPEEEVNLIVMLGQKESLEDIKRICENYSNIERVEEKLIEVKNFWKDLLHRIQVKTPDKTMDIMLNGWLMYQTISCRYWSRTAFYQSGGAMGFRDQLQDVMAAGYLKPEFTKEQILHSASRQFLEGDVQHWWHPVVNSGIRTRFSDDLLWLPFVTADYIKNTGDYSILDEEASYLEEEPLKEGEDERYKVTPVSDKKGSIYEHCIKAIDISLRFGSHNIPLMGSGDWNDGMSTVGNEGKGESVWLGWFLYKILDNFKELCRYKGDEERAEKYEKMRDFIGENLEKNAWDGGWYRRAYFDDGTPLGSMENDECQIDSLSQSWAVISGAAKRSRIEEAMEALERHLVKEDKGIVLLLTPAFNNSKLEPGYIKGYVPGVRENGGQYTHAATWVVLAMAKLGYGYKAWRIYHMINPINHSKSYLNAERYKVEPYVMTADVYYTEGHEGRGGWSWYTGASGWMYRVGIEGILGLKLEGGKGFKVEPTIPQEWNGYEIYYRKGEAKYNIQIKRGDKKEIYLDGKQLEDNLIPYLDSGEHVVEVII
ncbi:cyclic beta 1-2 glucan synthetase [Clostridium sp. SYSU_GA19001]|uniref:GH36-type glycosyl hydrolase domain-containing protein n=1 Tax=Clostridium caldaquaticum TaxID=2940653 RepID=UPI002077561B|nr:glucoamylase family protein [Clostridium caldaquaticum]MCM8709887.1 cyclic beta 1-2 glucan synthetase [Clostridium caldaquaticum]